MAEVFHAALYANPYRQNNGKTVSDMFPQLFEDDDEDDGEEVGAQELADDVAVESLKTRPPISTFYVLRFHFLMQNSKCKMQS